MKVAFVVQRYGEEIVGGSERLCWEVARHLKDHVDVEVITTCAKDYVTWANEQPAGVGEEAGVKVRRFPVKKPRNNRLFNNLYGYMRRRPRTPRWMQLLWMRLQGPYSPRLIKYLAGHKDDYDVLVFFTYLYYTTCHGIQVAPEKSILVPTAHDEPPIYYEIFDDVFDAPRGIIFLTPEERDFVHKRFGNQDIPNEVIGMGIDVELSPTATPAAGFDRSKPYILYFGRIEPAKGSDILFDYFRRYKEKHGGELNLVLFGQEMMSLPEAEDIVYLGRLTEAEKTEVIKGARAVVQPSPFESFSINTLESLLLEVPVLVNAQSEVLKGHCLRSKAGLYYNDFSEFDTALTRLLSDDSLRQSMGRLGRDYVEAEYDWDIIADRYLAFLGRIKADL